MSTASLQGALMLIDGAGEKGLVGARFVIEPSTGEAFAEAREATPIQALEAIAAARWDSRLSWRV